MTQSEDRQKALETAMAQINKKGGTNSIMMLGDNHHVEVETVSCGSLSIDLAIGGGVPYGRIVEIYGPESSGKTTWALHVIASAQKAGKVAAFIDSEHALDPSWATKIGVDISKMAFSQPSTGEEAIDTLETLINSGAVDIIVVDSVAALTPKAELEGEMGDQSMGLQARLMSKGLRKITGGVSKNAVTVIFINQLREKIGVMFGSPETTTGGKALKFYASLRLDIRRIGALTEGTVTVGARTKVKVVKNKIAPPFKIAEVDILYTGGFSREGDIIDLGVEHGLILKAGSWFKDKDTDVMLGQGKENARTFLIDNPDMADEYEKKIRDIVLPKKLAVEEVEGEGFEAVASDAPSRI